MSTKLLIYGGTARAVYDDRLRPLLDALGMMNVQRATRVEFDTPSGEWVATHIATSKEIARGKNRNEVIQAEIDWLEGKLNVTHCEG